jgi:hypothetical protein
MSQWPVPGPPMKHFGAKAIIEASWGPFRFERFRRADIQREVYR